jgi:RsiW-degrading membrane proteinase PrsW (M82 family)
MDPFLKPSETDRPVTRNRVYQSNLNIAVQSALAGALCLGLPAGLLFWLIVVQGWAPSTPIDGL